MIPEQEAGAMAVLNAAQARPIAQEHVRQALPVIEQIDQALRKQG